MNILLAEDDESLLEIISRSLEKKGYSVTGVSNGIDALLHAKDPSFHLLILDVMMPKLSGWDVAEAVRHSGSDLPILFITARGEKEDMLKSYLSGGNDYLRKPFHLEELFFRVEELKNRNLGQTEYLLGLYRFDPTRQTLGIGGNQEILSGKESALLFHLCKNLGRLLPRKEVLMELWGDDDFFSARNMDAYISKLRKRLKEDPSVQILNIRGLGYKLIT